MELSDDEAPPQLNQTVNTTDLNQEYEDELNKKPSAVESEGDADVKVVNEKSEPKVSKPQPKLQTKAKSDTLAAPKTINMRRSSRLI